jgi:ParB family chromosome partitioning protein
MTTPQERKIERWRLDRLTPHPKQAELFPEPPEHEVQELAADLKAHGQITPAEVLPDGTLLGGHRRLKAARHLGWAELTEWVREDLANDPKAAEARLIEDNLYRRNMGPLGRARCYQRLKELAHGTSGGRLYAVDKVELRDRLGKHLGVSGRTLDRHLRVVTSTPVEVQHAVEARKLPVTLAERVADLPKAQREQVAAQIAAGGKPADVVRAALPKPDGKHKLAKDAIGAFLRSLERGVADLEGRVESVGVRLQPEEFALLDRAEDLVRRLRKQANKRKQPPPSAGDAV